MPCIPVTDSCSENAGFAHAVTSAGLTFVGPPAATIAAMGDKARARVLAGQAGVPLIPGSGLVGSADEAVAAAGRIGYPVLVKAAAGGGGRGIRAGDEAAAALGAAGRAAGGGSVVRQRRRVRGAAHLPGPAHRGAGAGRLPRQRSCTATSGTARCSGGGRSCSRRLPRPACRLALRDQMTAAAVRLARRVGYAGAGTVEFLVDGDDFYFMEMNTRIQVEHPITELVTGLDLVAEQLRVAAGQPLSVRQEDISRSGHAVECRINAEDPDKKFMPRPGTVTALELPGGPGIRIEHALAPGTVVSPFYDSLVAKLCAWGTSRPQALARASQALAELEIGGLTTTAPLYRRLLEVPDVRSGRYHTTWLEEFLA